jgi:hypothetical protein
MALSGAMLLLGAAAGISRLLACGQCAAVHAAAQYLLVAAQNPRGVRI